MRRALADEELVTSDHVLVETWLLIASRGGTRYANAFWERIRRGLVTIEVTTSVDLETAYNISIAFPDQEISIVDCTSFAIMERLGIHRVATLDHHFAVYRFGRNRDRAFEIVN